jgi:hypothetical protein
LKECTKPTGSPPKCTNCSGDHPANFTGWPKYLQQLQFSQRNANPHPRKPPIPRSTPPLAQHQPHLPTHKTASNTTNPPRTWANIAAHPPPTQNQSYSGSIIDSIKCILSMFDVHKLRTQFKSLALQLQEANDPISRLVTIIDTVINCLSPSP